MTADDTYARFRLSTDQSRVESPVDVADDGEVEDYLVQGHASGLPVTVAWFEAQPAGDGMDVRWQTATETGNAGFNLYRASAPDAG